MRTNIIWTLLMIVLSFQSCQTQQNIIHDSEILVDLDNSVKKKKEFYSTYFSGGGIIALETTDNSLLGRIKKMDVTEDYLIFLDNKGVFLFQKDGKFLRRIGKSGPGPGEYSKVTDFTVDDINDKIYLLDASKRVVFVYDFESNYSHVIPLDSEGFYSRLLYYEGCLFFNILEGKGKDKWLLAKMDLNDNYSMNYYLDADEYNKGWYQLYYTDQRTFTVSVEGTPLFMQVFMDGIFRLNNDIPTPYISIVSDDLPTKSFVYELNKKNVAVEMPSSGLIYDISDYIENERFLSFKYYKDLTMKTFIHDKLSSSSYILDMLFNDILYSDETASYMISRFEATDRNRAYTIEGETLDERMLLLDNLDKGKINKNLAGYERLKMLNDDESNPVIVYYDFRVIEPIPQ